MIGLSATLIVARTRLPRVHGSVLLRITGWPGSAKRVQQRQGPVSMGPRARTVVDAVALYGAQDRPAVSWLILNRAGNTRLPADRGRSLRVPDPALFPAIRQMTSACTL